MVPWSGNSSLCPECEWSSVLSSDFAVSSDRIRKESYLDGTYMGPFFSCDEDVIYKSV